MRDQEEIVRKRRHLTPEEKYQIFLEATMAKAKENGNITEVLRRWGIHSSDLTRIKSTVEEGAISSSLPGHQPLKSGHGILLIPGFR